MELIKSRISILFQQEPGLIGLSAIDNPYPYRSSTDGLDLLLLIVKEAMDDLPVMEHFRIEKKMVLVCRTDRDALNRLLSGDEHRVKLQWLVRGEILYDRDQFLANVRAKLMTFPIEMKEQKLFMEFACFLSTYLQAKQDLQDNNLFDAHSSIIQALNHWAHITLVEAGKHPEPAIWRQMRRFHPGIYKLYEELTVSPETLEQRLKLVLLACEFSIMSKMKSCCALLLRILESRDDPWSLSEMQTHPEIAGLHINLSLVLQKLVQRAYIREVAIVPPSGDTEALELRYRSVL
ncbi:nucleotidyltransferase-like protein [Paenibacillus beijingensis]|uniref:Nucleotidyltransferase-like domain-containing protein n=1 Tax=Paenibacillus beijingensis TaxID=1126833 RepID=A0A0D5NF16_9BACL|nr:nucleotidyltransferase-like protein [Paenibacillus beijingensis]AJY73831.1 hypothetical protein VN24_03375 [Paenibacillus beijingensis]